MTTSSNIKFGKYTFTVIENTVMHNNKIYYKTLKLGGHYPDCVNVTINYLNNEPVSAIMPHVLYDEECVVSTPTVEYLDKGDGTKQMIRAIIFYIKTNYPQITELEYDDMSNIECATETQLKNSKNKKRGTLTSPMPLYALSILYNGQTWYEKYFNGRLKNDIQHRNYRERVHDVLYNKKNKPTDFNVFTNLMNSSVLYMDELEEKFNSTETYSDFFQSISKQNRCRLLLPFINKFIDYYFRGIFFNPGWVIPLNIVGGKKLKKTRKQYYLPKNIKITFKNTNYNNFGVDINDI
jgi:hypothetical protein